MAIIKNIYLGNKQVSKLAFGNMTINSVYLGNKLIHGQYCYNLYFINRSSSKIREFDFSYMPIIIYSDSCNSNEYTFDNTPYIRLKTNESLSANQIEIIYKNDNEMQTYVYMSSNKPPMINGNLYIPSQHSVYYTGSKISSDNVPAGYRGGAYTSICSKSDYQYNNLSPTYMWLTQKKIESSTSSGSPGSPGNPSGIIGGGINYVLSNVNYSINASNAQYSNGGGTEINQTISVNIEIKYNDSNKGNIFVSNTRYISSGNWKFNDTQNLNETVYVTKKVTGSYVNVTVTVMLTNATCGGIKITAYQDESNSKSQRYDNSCEGQISNVLINNDSESITVNVEIL